MKTPSITMEIPRAFHTLTLNKGSWRVNGQKIVCGQKGCEVDIKPNGEVNVRQKL